MDPRMGTEVTVRDFTVAEGFGFLDHSLPRHKPKLFLTVRYPSSCNKHFETKHFLFSAGGWQRDFFIISLTIWYYWVSLDDGSSGWMGGHGYGKVLLHAVMPESLSQV